MVHGWGASRRFWHGILDALGSRIACAAPDLIGFGDSDHPPGGFAVEDLADFIGNLVEALGARPLTLMGHSMGGMVCALLAARRPELVERLVLVNALVCGKRALYPKSRVMMLPLIRWMAYALYQVRPTRRWLTRDLTYACPLPVELQDEAVKGSYRSMLGCALSVRDADLTDVLGRITVPTLLIGTDRDHVVHPSQFEELRKGIPGARTWFLEETGHCPMIERPKEFVSRVGDFVL